MQDGNRLDVGESGPAEFLRSGDKFSFADGRDNREHLITRDLDSHFEYDGRPNKRLSKDTAVSRVGVHDPGERTSRVVDTLKRVVAALERDGDVSAWAVGVSDVISRAAMYDMDADVILSLEKLENVGSALFSRSGGSAKHGKLVVDMLSAADRKRWQSAVANVVSVLGSALMESSEDVLRAVISEIIKKCGQKWCLYSHGKDPKTGQRRRLGTHDSKSSAERQERAIQAHKHG